MSQDPQIDKLLKAVNGSLIELERIEEQYKTSKKQTREQMTQTVSQLAILADSQAVRAQVLRKLYWELRISAEVISAGFKMDMTRVRTLAGSYTFEYPCFNDCGGTYQKIFGSKAELERHEVGRRKDRLRDHFRHLYVCAECSKHGKEEAQRQSAQRESENAKRIASLRAMSWAQYAETPEWKHVRDNVLEHTEYGCELCGASNISLYVCLHKDADEYPIPVLRVFFEIIGSNRFYVLCESCLKRCEDLVHPEWREKLKAELLELLKRDSRRFNG